MNKVNRRHFLMTSMALPAALKASALPSPNNTVRVAVIGFNGRGKAHISAYLKMPNVEIAALCDVDNAVVESGCKMVEAAGKKRPRDVRRHPPGARRSSSIDAVSIATPNFHHTLQTIWAVQAGKDVLVEKPVSYNMFEAQQIIAAARKYNRIVQDGTGAQLWLHEAKKRMQGRHHRRRLHGARPLLQVARHDRPRQGRTGARRASRTICGPARRRRSRSRAIASTTTGTGSGTTATATSATRAPIRFTRRAWRSA